MAASEQELLPSLPSFELLQLTRGSCFPSVAILRLSRPAQRNALTPAMLLDLQAAMAALDSDPSVRVVLLEASGRHFCAGIDVACLAELTLSSNSGGRGIGRVGERERECEGRRREKLRRDILTMQEAISSIEKTRKPVIAAIHGSCIGAGVDLIAACDIRYCTKDAEFSIKEVDMALAADFGVLQRLPRLVGEGNARELALTGRSFGGEEAKKLGLVQGVYGSEEEMREGAMQVATAIAAKSPLAVTGTKAVLLHARDHSVADGLDYVATWNSATLVSEDMREVMAARRERRAPQFARL